MTQASQTDQASAPVVAAPAQAAGAQAAAEAQIATAAAPEAAYSAARAARQELRNQLDALVSQRHGLLRELEDHAAIAGPARTGMEQRITQLDTRIVELDKAIAIADASVAQAAAIPGAVVPELVVRREGPPEEVYIVAIVFTFAVLLPLALAKARRIWRGSGRTPAPVVSRELMQRLDRLEQLGEATSLEVERIGEGQRFVTRLLTEKSDRALADRAGVSRGGSD